MPYVLAAPFLCRARPLMSHSATRTPIHCLYRLGTAFYELYTAAVTYAATGAASPKAQLPPVPLPAALTPPSCLHILPPPLRYACHTTISDLAHRHSLNRGRTLALAAPRVYRTPTTIDQTSCRQQTYPPSLRTHITHPFPTLVPTFTLQSHILRRCQFVPRICRFKWIPSIIPRATPHFGTPSRTLVVTTRPDWSSVADPSVCYYTALGLFFRTLTPTAQRL